MNSHWQDLNFEMIFGSLCIFGLSLGCEVQDAMARMQREAQQLPLTELPAELNSIRIRMASIEDLMEGLN
jgi:hypothetical protein